MSQIDAVLERAVRHAQEHLRRLDESSVAATATHDELLARLSLPLPERGTDPSQVIDELVAATAGGHLGSESGRFFGWVIGGALPSALAADWLTAAWNNNPGIFACGPAGTVVEEVAGAWLKELLGLPSTASFAFTTGCQMAHATCLAAARHAVLARAGWDVETDGLFGAPPIRVLANADFHSSSGRSLRLLGIGNRAVEKLPADAHGSISVEHLRSALSTKSGPVIVLLNAGDINRGTSDAFDRVIPVAHEHGAWVHVDGAFGLWAAASARYRPLVKGIEQADSWATDAHKWLNVPKDSGLAFVRDSASHCAAMTVSNASYLSQEKGARHPIDWTPEFSRRARGFAVYAALRELGREGIEALVDRCCAHAQALARGLAKLPNTEVLNEPVLNQVLVRFKDPSARAAEGEHDRRTEAVIAAVNRSGEALFGSATWQGKRVMRVSVVNWRTTETDVARTLAAFEKVLATPGPA